MYLEKKTYITRFSSLSILPETLSNTITFLYELILLLIIKNDIFSHFRVQFTRKYLSFEYLLFLY